MSEFWVLSEPETPDSERRLASWPSDEALEYQRVFCSVKPHAHLGVRDRITTPLSAVLANLEPYDFVWTWLGECLVQRRVLDVLRKHGFTGYEAIPAKVKFKSWSKSPPQFWEVAIRGSAGVASPGSGIRVLRKCPGCDLTDYSRATDPAKVVDTANWDGSDFFRVKPVSGWIFVSNRVVEALEESVFTGWQAKSTGQMQDSFDIVLGSQTSESPD
jgi:hypothetical protein